MSYEIIHKQAFTNQLLALPHVAVGPVLKKVELLRTAPQPDAKNKKRFVGYQGSVYRIRAGNYRVLYTFGDRWVTLLGVDHRDDVYDKLGQLVAEAPAISLDEVEGVENHLSLVPSETKSEQTIAVVVSPAPDEALNISSQIDEDLLIRLRVPQQYFAAILAAETLDELIVADIPDAIRNSVFDVIAMPDYDQVLQQPDFVTGNVDDLRRYANGELVGFLLKLDPEQERYVRWAVHGSGPTLVKGGPGTGKSTVALYSVRAIIAAHRERGTRLPSILVTTYTNALVSYSHQLLQRLLGDDAELVDVRTADSIARGMVAAADGPLEIADDGQLRALVHRAIATVGHGRAGTQSEARERMIDRLGIDYLLDEIGVVITGRALRSLDDYLVTPRAGRRVRLSAPQRAAIWEIYEAFERLRVEKGWHSWHSLRRRAAEIAAGGKARAYDRVVVDEAQDLDPTVLRMLLGLCAAPDRLFVTADANQSIYGSGFRWADVHADLRFQGRTATLRTNHRSTREIVEAARAYLLGGALEVDDQEATAFALSGLPPVIHTVASATEGIQLLSDFLKNSARTHRVGMGSCAVLVPTEAAARQIERWLSEAGINAEYMKGKNLNLDRPVVKVITLKSAKGLEFPIVAIAGFGIRPYPGLTNAADPDQLSEVLDRGRRTLYVAMTRAMRALTVYLPAQKPGPLESLLDGFDGGRWTVRPDATHLAVACPSG